MAERRVTRQQTAKATAPSLPKPAAATRVKVNTIPTTVTATKASQVAPVKVKTKAPTPEPDSEQNSTHKRPREAAQLNDLKKAMANLKKSVEIRKKVSIEDIKELGKDFGKAISQAKRDAQEQNNKLAIAKPSRTSRSGLKRGQIRRVEEYTQGKYIVKGMDDAREEFDDDELEYLDKEVKKVKQVKNLKFEHIKYLVSYKFLPELKRIKQGESESSFHNRFIDLKGKCKNELLSEMRMTLFTNEQKDYLNGYLQNVFEANQKDENGDIKHSEISYVETVMLYETSLRIVKFVHDFESIDETLAFMKSKSREMYGISSDEDED